jgi:hypothetical protein
MKTRLRLIVAMTFIGPVCAPRPAHAQAKFEVGSHTACTTLNCVDIVSHSMGVQPVALILWTNGKTGTTFTANYMWGFGVTDGTNSRQASAGSQNNVGSNAGSQASRRGNSSVLQILQGTTSSGTVLAEATFTSWSSSDFRITWGTNNGGAYVYHYILIGGSAVSVQQMFWQAALSNTNDCCTGTTTNFQPSLVMDVQHGTGTGGSCTPCQEGAIGAGFGFGVMDVGGNMWANSFLTIGNVKAKDTQRGQKSTGYFIYGFNSSLTTQGYAVTCTTTPCLYGGPPNGFRFNYTTDNLAELHAALALSNINFKVGSFAKCSSTGGCSNQNAISGLGFQPGAVIMTSVQETNANLTNPIANSMYGFGASDGTHVASSALTDADCAGSNCTSSVWGIDSTTDAFIKVNNVGTSTTAPTVDARGAVAMNSDGFTVTWSPNDTATTEILYLALGPLNVSSVTLATFTATRLPDGTVRLDWRTGYEVDNVGFRVYREHKGKRVRITSSIVPGSALMGGRGMSVGGRSYTWSDAVGAPADAGTMGEVRYWLEDVDLKGKSTWHGPIVPGPESTKPR